MKKCPYCAESIQDEAVFCRHCRRPLPTEAPVPVNEPLEVPVLPVSPAPIEYGTALKAERKRKRAFVWMVVDSVLIGIYLLVLIVTSNLNQAIQVWFPLVGVGLGWLFYKKNRFGWSFWLSFLMTVVVPILVLLLPVLIWGLMIFLALNGVE